MTKYFSVIFIAVISFMLSSGNALGASGSVTLTTPKEGQIYKTYGDFWVKGTFIVSEDSTAISTGWCSDGIMYAALVIEDYLPYPFIIGRVKDYPCYGGGTAIGSVHLFEYPISIAAFDPNIEHTIRIYLRDRYGGDGCSSYESAIGCTGAIFAEKSFTFKICKDNDGDGYSDCDDDCNDNDSTIFPGAPELCDGKDNNCNGEVDEGTGPCCKDPWLCQQCQDPQSTAGHPISLLSGAEAFTRTDLTIGSLYPITIERRYSSLSSYDSQLGYGWALNYDKRLYTYTDDSVTVRKGCGWKRRFIRSGSNFITPADDSGTLVQNADGTYTWSQINGEKEIYDSQGRLARMVDAKGNWLEIFYEAVQKHPLIGLLPANIDQFTPLIVSYDYRIIRIEEHSASNSTALSSVNFIYDTNSGRLREIVPSSGPSVGYAHDGIGNLISVAGPNGMATYGYNSAVNKHYVTSTDEGKGLYVNEYDAQGRIFKQSHAGGDIVIDYITPETKTKVTTSIKDLNGNLLNTSVRMVEFDGAGAPARVTDTFGNVIINTRDSNSRITREEKWENTGTVESPSLVLRSATDYTYDGLGNMLTKTEAQGTALEKTTTYTYHPVFNSVLTETVQSVVIPGQVRVITNTYDETNGTLLTATEQGLLGSGAPYSYTTTNTYYPDGKLHTTDGPRTDVQDITEYTYASAGYIGTVIRPLIGTTTYSNHDGLGNPRTVTDANGNSTLYTYDNSGRVQTVKAPGDMNVTQYFYISSGCSSCGGGASNKIDHIILPEGNAINYSYDTLGNLRSIGDSLGNSINYTYDSEGNRLTEEIKDASQALQKSLSYSYDALNRLYHVTNPDSSYTEYAYDFRSNRKSARDPKINTTNYAYDELGRLKTVTQPGTLATTYGYDTNNNLTSVKDTNNNTTTYKMDDKGRVYQIVSPDTNTTTYGYDPAGNMINKIDAKGVTINYAYDALNRLTLIVFPSDTGITYTYDICLNGKGRLCTMTDASGATGYEYSPKGQITKETKVIDSHTYITQYTYDQNGNVKTMTYPSGKVIDYHYTNDKVDLVKNGAANLATSIAYKPFGGVSAITYGNGLISGIGYDTQYRIATLATSTFQNLTYGYDNNGNITSITPGKDYSYDALDRLGTATGPWGSLGWTYDGVGNRLTENSNTYTYSPNTNKLTNANDLNFGYDNNGNTTTQAARTYTYNQNQRLIQVAEGAMTAGYTYNGNGQRVKKNVNGIVTIFHYSLNGQIIAESNSAGTINAEYVYLNGQPLAKLEGANTYYYHNDHLGTPQKMTDSSGTVVWAADYKPFGEANITTSTVTNNIRFPGQYFDQETGLHYNYFRDYNPIVGRYAEADPIGIQKGTNHLYVYVNENPLRFTDAKGLGSCGSGLISVPGGYGPGSFHYSFENACENHDKCYGTCKTPKASCDVDFLFNMRDVCNGVSGFAYFDCMTMAHTYYLAVALFGDISYNVAQYTACKQCKNK